MSEQPIMAREVEVEKPKRERLHIAIGYDEAWISGNPESDAARAIRSLRVVGCDETKNDAVFILPGSDESWTEAKVRAAANKFIDDNGWSPDAMPELVAFARVLGVIGGEK